MTTLHGIPTDVPDPETGDEKEVYAFYGLASYYAQVCEKGVGQLAILLRLDRIDGPTRTHWDRESEALDKLTLGQLLKEVIESQALENDLRNLVRRALKERNRLIHHFFWDHAEDFFSKAGRIRMIIELQKAIVIFSAADAGVNRVVDSMAKDLGASRTSVEEVLRKLLVQDRQEHGSSDYGDALN